MTAKEFRFWLDGYLFAKDKITEEDKSIILEKLNELSPDEREYIPYPYPVYPSYPYPYQYPWVINTTTADDGNTWDNITTVRILSAEESGANE